MTDACLNFGPLEFRSVAGALLFCIAVAILIAILIVRKLRPVCRHEAHVRHIVVDPKDFYQFFESDEGKVLLCRIAHHDQRVMDALLQK